MDTLKIPNGGSTGMRLYGDDFEFMQTGIQQAIVAINKRFIDANGGSIVLSGCQFNEVTAGTYNITGGWVVISNQVAYFVGDTVTFSGTVDFSTVELELYTYDYPSAPAFRNVGGLSYTPWKRTEARLKTVPGITLPLSASNRIENVMRSLIVGTTNVVADVLTLESGVILSSGTTVHLAKEDKKSFLLCNLVVSSSTNYNVVGGVKIATLPTGFAPVQEVNVPIGSVSNGNAFLILKTNGDVMFQNSATFGSTTAYTIYLNVYYLTA